MGVCSGYTKRSGGVLRSGESIVLFEWSVWLLWMCTRILMMYKHVFVCMVLHQGLQSCIQFFKMCDPVRFCLGVC